MSKWIVVRVDEEFHTALKRACVDARETMSKVVRRVLAKWMKEREEEEDRLEGTNDAR